VPIPKTHRLPENTDRCNHPCLCCPQCTDPGTHTPSLIGCGGCRVNDVKEIPLAFKRPDPNARPTSSVEPPLDDPQWKDTYPNTYSFLFDGYYDDGKARKTGSISVFVQMGALKVCITDKDMSRMAFLTATTWADLWDMVEMAICDDGTVWKASSSSFGERRPPF